MSDHSFNERGTSHQPRANISDSARLMPGAYIGPGVVVGENVLIGPNAVILGKEPNGARETVICDNVEIGANATVLPGVSVGVRARVSPGSVVARSVPPLAIVAGNPACITGYVETADGILPAVSAVDPFQTGVQQSRVKGVVCHRFRMVQDLRGSLSAGEFEREIPFTPKRYFLVLNVPTEETRGEHAHRKCHQFLIAIKGSVNVVADDGLMREEFVLDRPYLGLYLPPMTWGIQYRYSTDAVLAVFASHYYDPDDYIRDYSDFLRLVETNEV